MSLAYPLWPPGLWRRIVLHPGPGWIGAGLEDDMHRFHLRIDHADGRIVGVSARALRHPWSACPGAAPHLAGELTGQLLRDVARRDPGQHCTHLLDLAILCAAHADDHAFDRGPTRFDMRVADRVDDRTTATLAQDDHEALRWQLGGTLITGPAAFAGRDLRQLSAWKAELAPADAERAVLLRRAIFVSGGRAFVPPTTEHAADQGPVRMGACYNYQLPQAEASTRTPSWRWDFSAPGREPLAAFDAAADLGALGTTP